MSIGEHNTGGWSPLNRRRRLHLAPQIESLDQRIACAGMALAMSASAIEASPWLKVDTITPLTNSSTNLTDYFTSANPPRFELSFNQPIDQTSLQRTDFEVDEIGADGSITPLSSQAAKYSESIDFSGPTSTNIILSFDTLLAQGDYQIVLKSSNQLSGSFGQAQTEPNDQILMHFSVGQSAVTGSSIDLGTIDANTTGLVAPVSSGSLDGPMDQVVLGAGQTWMFSPQFGNQSLDHYRLDLYDANGQFLADAVASDLSQIRDQIGSGTYYLRFFATNPGQDASASQVNLSVTGTPVDNSIETVTSILPLNANGLTDDADSIDVQFAGTPRSPGFTPPSNTNYVLVDGQGVQYPVNFLAYDPISTKMRLAFTSDLPTGHYSLEATSTKQISFGSSTKLETLGSFDTVFEPRPNDDLGTIYPLASNPVGSASKRDPAWKNATDLAPGGSVSEQFSIIEGGEYQLDLSNKAVDGQLVQLSSADSKPGPSISIESRLGMNYYLNPGIYEFVALNSSEARQKVSFLVASLQISDASLSSGGVVQIGAVIDRSSLVGGATSLGSQTSESTNSISLSTNSASNPSQASSLITNPPVESSGSFSLAAINPAPLGSFAIGKETSLPLTPGNAMYTEVMVMGLNNTIFLRHSTTGSPIPRSKLQVGSSRRLAATPEPVPNREALPGAEVAQVEVVATSKSVPTDDHTPVEISAAITFQAISEAIKDDIEQTYRLDGPGGPVRAISEPLDLSLGMKSIAASFGVLLSTFVIYQQVKIARRHSGASSSKRTWATPRFRLKLGVRQTSKPSRPSFVSVA